MKKIFFACIAIVLFSSHTMFLKLDSYFLEPNTSVSLQLFNGTFEESENVIDRNRMLDASILNNGVRTKVADFQWTEKDSITFLNFKTGEAGTYVAGVSTKARSLAMDAEAFNDYLEHEGIYDMLEWRKNNDALDSAAVEKYSKHVKTIFQVGAVKTNDWQTALGYPIEFIPLQNPYDLNTGDSLEVKLLLNGKLLANQLVYADYYVGEKEHTHSDSEPHSYSSKKVTTEHSHDGEEPHSHEVEENEESHTHATGQKLRTNAEGIAKAHLSADGVWYFQTIHLVNTEEEGLTHESNWTTLTFEVTHAHGADTHTHEHEHKISKKYIFLIGSVLLVGILFLWFNRKNNENE
jgi:uncharacterized GH25 family protein